jgi:hypothetical protein
MTNKLIEGARFSTRAADEQRLRELRRADAAHLPTSVTDFLRRMETFWDRAAQGFRKHDLGGGDLASLTKEIR